MNKVNFFNKKVHYKNNISFTLFLPFYPLFRKYFLKRRHYEDYFTNTIKTTMSSFSTTYKKFWSADRLIIKILGCSDFCFLLHFFSYYIQHCFTLPPLKFHCADGCWDRTQDRCNWCIGSQTLLPLSSVPDPDPHVFGSWIMEK